MFGAVQMTALFINLMLNRNIAIPLITNSRFRAHTEGLFTSSKILPLEELNDYFKLLFIQQLISYTLPASFRHVWSSNIDRNRK